MCLPDYYRDIWCLGPSSNGYPGAFPRGFVRRVLARWNGMNRLWLFSGSYHPEKDLFANDTTVDIKPELEPDVMANCESLPFSDNSFDFVLADPPYSEAESLELYDLPYVSIVKTLYGMWRVGGWEG